MCLARQNNFAQESDIVIKPEEFKIMWTQTVILILNHLKF
jgi:hypothetical protein